MDPDWQQRELPELPQQELLQPGVMRLLTSAFEISPADVTADAHQVMEWRGSNDDLLVSIAERYQWSAKTTARYLRNLLFALGSPARNHWPSGKLAVQQADQTHREQAEHIRAKLAEQLQTLRFLKYELRQRPAQDVGERALVRSSLPSNTCGRLWTRSRWPATSSAPWYTPSLCAPL